MVHHVVESLCNLDILFVHVVYILSSNATTNVFGAKQMCTHTQEVVSNLTLC